MDMRSWKKVLLQWITECGFLDRIYFNIEQSDIDFFYQNFSLQHQKTATDKCQSLGVFLKVFYPSFEINFDDENCVSSAEYIYVYSLLLHFCCVKHPETVFHEICQRLPDHAQRCIASFFKELINTELITKEALRHAIAEVANSQCSPPRLNDSFSSSVSGGGLSSASFPRYESPLKTPKRITGPQRVSPSTPKTFLLEERTRELYNLRALLETERYDKGLLEVQIKQNEDKIQKLNVDHKRLLQQIQNLKNDILVTTTDGSTNRDGEENQIQKRILKEMSKKEEEIMKLSDSVRTMREEKSLVEEKLKYAEKQIVLCMSRIKELDFKVDELKDELEKKDEHIQYLTDNKTELEQFISNTRCSAGEHNDSSVDCMDGSFLRNSNNTNGSNSLSSPENLGASVVDVQLREKEHENQLLKEELLNVKREHKRVAKHLIKLTQEFDFSIDASSPANSEDSEVDYEGDKESGEESSPEKLISCEEQFKIFNSCMEKIDKFHKTEKTKINQLEQQSHNLQVENENLAKQLSELTAEINVIKEQLVAKEKLQQEMEKSKEQNDFKLQESQNHLTEAENQKNTLYKEVQSLKQDKETLNKNIVELKTQLELQQNEQNKNEQSLHSQLQLQQKELADKTRQWEEELRQLSEQIAKQIEDIETYKQTEQIIKSNYEQLVVENEKLKKEARQANNHLSNMRNELKEKENELYLLGKEISEFGQKNKTLEQNINSLMAEQRQEKLTNHKTQTELDEQLRKLKDQLTKTELLRDSKQHECDLNQQKLEDLKTKLNALAGLLNVCAVKQDIFDYITVTENQVKVMLKNNKDLQCKVLRLQETHTETSTKIQELTHNLQEKSETLAKAHEEVLKLNVDKLDSEQKMAQLQQEKVTVLEKCKQDLQGKDQELQECLREASAAYEASMERIGVELKLEKQHHNNKEMELILIAAELNEAKKQLTEIKQELLKILIDNQNLQQNCERLKQFETKLHACSEENDKLRSEIETFKQEVTQNALRLLEADKALAEFMELTKEQDTAKSEVELLKINLQEKEKTLAEMELTLKQQSCYEEQLDQLKLNLDEQNDLLTKVQEQLEQLLKDKERLSKEVEEKAEQISKEQQDKLMLLSSLEKSTDQLKSSNEEQQQQTTNLEQHLLELKEKFNSVTIQNTKLQSDLVEREAELSLALNKQQQEKEDFEQQLKLKLEKLCKKTDQLQLMDIAVMEIVAIMENNFNLSHELLLKVDQNVFKFNEAESEENNIQKLRKHLNLILLKQQQLNEQLKDVYRQREEANVTVATLRDSNNDLLAKLCQQDKTLKEFKEQLENEELIIEKRVFHEVKILEGDLLNLEMVNERLANENVKIQVTLGNIEQELKDSKLKNEALEEESLTLREEVRSKSLLLEKLQQEDKKLQKILKEKSQHSEETLEKYKQLELQLKDKTSKLQKLEKEHHELKEKCNKNEQKLAHYHQSQQNHLAEHMKVQEKLKQMQTANESLETDAGNKNKELLALKNKNSELLQQNKDLEQQLHITSNKLDEMLTNRLNAETKCEQLQSELQQLKRELEFIKSQQHTQQEDNSRLLQEIDSLKVDKQHLRDEVHENKLTLQRSNDNVTQLIQQISSIRLEKEAVLAENLLLRKQLEETGKNQSSSETKMKSIMESSQDFERKLLTAENELKSLKINLEKFKTSSEKLQAENKKLRDTHEISTKRIEKMALKLGDSQAKSVKLERDNEKLCRTLEAHATTVEALQKEKDLLQDEAKKLKERLSRAERGHEQLAVKVKSLEYLNTSLQQIKQKLEASEIDGKTKLNKLEKMRDFNEEKIRKLTNLLNNAENSNVKLNLEIGALNSQLQEVKVEHNQEQSQQKEVLNHQLLEAQESNQKYQELQEKLKIELTTLKEENYALGDQLSKAALSLQITSQKCERFATEIEKIRADMLVMRQEKSQIELQHEACIQKLNQFESQNTKLVYERKNLIKSLEQNIANLEEQLAVKSKEVVDLQKDIATLRENSASHASLLHQNTASNLSVLDDLRTKLSLAEEIRLKETEIISQLRLDNQILHTKYQESKQRALDANKSSEERIKENRLELEGKLEKMKNKMKTLYTEEITKMKTKQEREMAIVKSEMEVLKAQNSKYEEHTRKLSNQIVRLNDNILQLQKENTMLSTKLKHIMDQIHESELNKRHTSLHVSTISSSTAPVTGANIATNLAMEDEEGEVFNNTYLTDLKNSHTSELMSREVCLEELKYRNSLQPPHLRCTYAAQFDHEFPEEDIKDGPHSFDDSMSALLSTTAGGTRKKCSGVTHYKRPGPPTPSKNGGRLSFGGLSEPGREILKESYDTNAGSTVSSSKTPARFNFFASRFSLGTARDEKKLITIKKESGGIDLQKVIKKSCIKGNSRRLLTGVGCTSTPRKSKVHYDQRRLLDQLMTSSPSPSPLALGNEIVKIKKKITSPNVSIIETPLTALDIHALVHKAPVRKSNNKRMEAIAGGLRRSRRNSSMFGRRLSRRMQEICTPTTEETTSSALSTPAVVKDKNKRPLVVSSTATTSGGISKLALLQRRLRKKPKHNKDSRPSLYLKGNIFAKHRTPNNGVLRDLNLYKSRKQRLDHFNLGRNLNSFKVESQQEETDKTISCKAVKKNITYDLKNNNYAIFNHNKVVEDTAVLAKCQPKAQEYQKNTFPFGEEQFAVQHNDELDYMEDYESEEEYEDETGGDDGDEEEEAEEEIEEKNEMKHDIPIKQEYFRQDLITSQDLEDFDRYIANNKVQLKNEKHDDDYSSQGSSKHFAKLLVETESNAPFAVKHIQLNVCKSSRSSCASTHSYSSHSSHSLQEHDHTTLSTATPHHSPNNPTSQLSRTIYGGTVIYNHRLPNINTTFVRKSSIYIKNRKRSSHHHHQNRNSSSSNDVVLITNQTITFVDIMRMWSQMDSTTRLIVCFAVLASFTSLLGLVVSFCSQR